jgi:hypothetical protein
MVRGGVSGIKGEGEPRPRTAGKRILVVEDIHCITLHQPAAR